MPIYIFVNKIEFKLIFYFIYAKLKIFFLSFMHFLALSPIFFIIRAKWELQISIIVFHPIFVVTSSSGAIKQSINFSFHITNVEDE